MFLNHHDTASFSLVSKKEVTRSISEVKAETGPLSHKFPLYD